MTPAKWIHQRNQHNSVSNKRDKTSNFISGPKFSYYQGEEGLPNFGCKANTYNKQEGLLLTRTLFCLIALASDPQWESFSASLIECPKNAEVYYYLYIGLHFPVHSKHLSVNAETLYMFRLLRIKPVHLTTILGTVDIMTQS